MQAIRTVTACCCTACVGQLSIGRALMLSLDIARGLAELHAIGIIVADLNPANVLLEEQGRAVITDFGISKAYSTVLGGNVLTSVAGTPAYMCAMRHAPLLHV